MEAFLKGAKLPGSKNGPSSSQKQSKEKKQREKPLPWVEKVIYLGILKFLQMLRLKLDKKLD